MLSSTEEPALSVVDMLLIDCVIVVVPVLYSVDIWLSVVGMFDTSLLSDVGTRLSVDVSVDEIVLLIVDI